MGNIMHRMLKKLLWPVSAGLYKVLMTVVMVFSKRDFSLFDDKAAALDYLAG